MVFVYQKTDDINSMTGNLDILHTVLVESHRTADYQTTSGIQRIIGNNGNVDDILAFLEERRLPVDEIEGMRIAEQVLDNPPGLGYLTISNALQWRLQYNRVISEAGNVPGDRSGKVAVCPHEAFSAPELSSETIKLRTVWCGRYAIC